MENLLTLADLNAFLQHFFRNSKLSGGDLLVIHEDTTLLNKLASLLVGRSQTASDHQSQDTNLAVHQLSWWS